MVMENKKPSEKEAFVLSGPIHLTSVDWSIVEHRRSVAASLVKGVYILERDRQKNRSGDNAEAPTWWEFFHFRCIQTLQDKHDSSIFGAIFEYTNDPKHPMGPHHCGPPRYVVAFRGTILRFKSGKRDIWLDVKLAWGGLSQDARYETALREVKGLVKRVGSPSSTSVWLAGHSLGAAIALQAGKDMAKRGCHIESYLFNPPYASLPVEIFNNPNLKDGIRIVGSFTAAGLSLATSLLSKNSSSEEYDPFAVLCSWTPHLFVNPDDPICSEYIGYFEHREKMEAWWVGVIERIATETSILGLVSGQEVTHLVPSACLTKNMINIKQNPCQAHSLHQWWKPHTHYHSKIYQMTK